MKKNTSSKEYMIFKHTGQSGMYQKPTGLIVVTTTKKEAINEARKQLGRGSYEAHEKPVIDNG